MVDLDKIIDQVFDEDAHFTKVVDGRTVPAFPQTKDQFGYWIGRVCATLDGPRDILEVNKAVGARLA
jgi:hypothetical protein